ncbi:MAG: CHASE domain-containing protein [Acidobacteriota bacterium]|nr:CHASE domain-containing protein [Acidobacteriota bacterium]
MPEPPGKTDEQNKTGSFPYLVLAVSLLLTVGAAYIYHQNAKTKDQTKFNGETVRLQLAIENKINLYIALLKGGRGFIEANQDINRRNFSEYVSSLGMEKNYTGVQGIGYSKTVTARERDAFIKKMESEGNTGFNIFPAAEKDFYQIIVYLEPANENSRKKIGFDVSSEVNRLAALNLAADSDEAAASGKINLAANSEEAQPGFLIYLPIYKKGDPPRREDRRKNVAGYIFSPFPADRFLGEIQNNQSAADILLKIYDGAVSDENLLMRTGETLPEKTIPVEENYSAQKELDVTGRKWIVQFDSSKTFAAQSNVGWTPLILIVGTILSLLLFGMTYWETFARIKLQATAVELFKLQEQKQELYEKEQAARLSAEQANRTKDEFIAVVSHELRTPLNAIAGWTRILRSEDVSDNTKNTALEKIEKNLRSQTNLVGEMLDYSQLASGTFEIERRQFSISEAFENTCAEIEPTARLKNVVLVKDNRLNGQIVAGDENKIRHVIHSILNNAVKFTPAGGKIEADISETGGVIRMNVKDTGEGISREFLPHIFDRFTQADSSTTRRSGGLGLGLTVSSQIVKLHQGTIEAVSEGAGKGSVFTVKLPLFIEIVEKNAASEVA